MGIVVVSKNFAQFQVVNGDNLDVSLSKRYTMIINAVDLEIVNTTTEDVIVPRQAFTGFVPGSYVCGEIRIINYAPAAATITFICNDRIEDILMRLIERFIGSVC